MPGHPTDDFPRLLTKLGNLINQGATVTVTPDTRWKQHGQLMLIKAYGHLKAIADLAKLEQLNSDATVAVHIDHSSIAVLGRATYETYVLFHFLFCCEDPGDRKFRHTVWRLSGLIARSKLNKPTILPPEVRAQIARETAMIGELKKAVESDPRFAALKAKDRKGQIADNVRNGKDVRLGIPLIELAVQAGLPRKYAADMYTHFCNYSHAGAVSIFQLHDSLQDGSSVIMTRANIAFCCALLCQMARSYIKLFPEVEGYATEDDELQDLVATWQELAQRFSEIY